MLPTTVPGCCPIRRNGSPSDAPGRRDSARMLPRCFRSWKAISVRARPTGKVSIEVPLSAFPGNPHSLAGPIGRIVFLERGPGSEPAAGAGVGRRGRRPDPARPALVRARGECHARTHCAQAGGGPCVPHAIRAAGGCRRAAHRAPSHESRDLSLISRGRRLRPGRIRHPGGHRAGPVLRGGRRARPSLPRKRPPASPAAPSPTLAAATFSTNWLPANTR